MKECPLDLGFVGIDTELRQYGIYPSRTIQLDRLNRWGKEHAMMRALLNIENTKTIILWAYHRGIRSYRITSFLFPHLLNPDVLDPYGLKFARRELRNLGQLIRNYHMRVTAHPPEFTMLTSPRRIVVDRALRDLRSHAEIFQTMGLYPQSDGAVFVLHLCTYDSTADALRRFKQNFRRLSKQARQYIVIENTERGCTVKDLLPLSEEMDIPIVIDTFHHEINGAESFNLWDDRLIRRVMRVWKRRGIRPKLHISEQRAGSACGSHSDYVEVLPPELLRVACHYRATIMIEAKMKEDCAMRLLRRYGRPTQDGWVMDTTKIE